MKNSISIPGQHILSSLYGSENIEAMFDGNTIYKISDIIKQAGLDIIDIRYYSFGEGMGYTAFIPLGESHFSIHTWPELEDRRIDLDLFTCNVNNDNRNITSEIYNEIIKIFKPKDHRPQFITRGQRGPYWGYHLLLNLKSCNAEKIRSKDYIDQFTKSLCDFIDMKRFGDPVIVNFGEAPEVSGYSMFQLIETSNVSAHFVEQTNDVYLDIFSCKSYPVQSTIDYCMKEFEAVDYNHIYVERQA